MNPTLEKLADAFAEVEKFDIRVGRVELQREIYTELVASRDIFNVYTNNSDLMRVRGQSDPLSLGMLWGASVKLGEKTRVFGERGYMPGWHHNRIEPGYDREQVFREYSVDVFDDAWLKNNKFRLKLNRLRGNLTIIVKSRADSFRGAPKSEWRAIETLRDMITEREFRKYMKYGFVLVPGKSGAIYQIFRNRWHTRVWKNGEIIEEVCVRLEKCPPTDNVIAFMTMIQTDEEEFKKIGNVYNMKKAA